MKRVRIVSSLAFLVIASIANAGDSQWQCLFDGKSLEGWNIEDHDECFKVKDGAIVADGGPLARYRSVSLWRSAPTGVTDTKA
jgi:hypothetical protein